MAEQLDELDDLAAGDLRRVIALMLWKERHRNPEMAVLIDRKDMKGLAECAQYLDVEPDVRVFRRAAIPARAADGKIPGSPGVPAAEFVTVVMVAKGTEDTFRPIENNEDDAKKADREAQMRQAKASTGHLANMVYGQASQGEFSSSLVMELAQNAMVLARA